MFREAAFGRFPPHDGALEFLPSTGLAEGIVSFTGHNLIATNLDPDEVRRNLHSDDPGAPMHPRFLAWFATQCDSAGYTPELVLASPTAEARPEIDLSPTSDFDAHPRVRMARGYRSDVRVLSDKERRGIVIIGEGIVGRIEVAMEIAPDHRDKGLGRELAQAALVFAAGDVLFAQVAPGNVASLRAFLAAGYRPICSEVWFRARPR
jgi:hypothetical protein